LTPFSGSLKLVMTTSASPRANRRRAKRVVVAWPALVIQGQCRWSCTILNISERGAKLDISGTLATDSTMILSSPRFGDLAARLKWRKARHAGLEFLEGVTEVRSALKGLLPSMENQAPQWEAPAPSMTPTTPTFGRRGLKAGEAATVRTEVNFSASRPPPVFGRRRP
jgi:hypothetical protein